MPMYVRHTRSITIEELPVHIRHKLVEHAEARQIRLDGVRIWLTHSENPPARSGLKKLLGRRSNPTDPDAEHVTVVVIHPTQILVATDGAKRGTAVLSLPLAMASVAPGTALGAAFNPAASGAAGFTITGFEGD